MTIKFTCTSLAGMQKKGVLVKDADGYYDTVVGGLNMLNSAGMYYGYDDAKALFESSSALMRRIKRGALRSEQGHPTIMPGEKFDAFVQRYMDINPKNVCAHIAELYLDFDNFKDLAGRPIVAIRAKVAPAGPFGYVTEKAFENGKENVCFSIRAFTHDYPVRGVIHRALKEVITFDYVNEPGIYIAEKFRSPALESLLEKTVTRDQFMRAMNKPGSGMAMESAAMDVNELFTALNWTLPGGEKPIFSKW